MSEHNQSPSAGRDELESRLHQQALLAEFGRRALAGGNADTLFAEATRMAAVGMAVRFCKVLEYLPDENRFLVRAGVGWHEGVVGHAKLGAELSSPAGYALHTGKPVISNRLHDEDRFETPELLLEHGVRRALDVILLGDGQPYGVLEVDSEIPEPSPNTTSISCRRWQIWSAWHLNGAERKMRCGRSTRRSNSASKPRSRNAVRWRTRFVRHKRWRRWAN